MQQNIKTDIQKQIDKDKIGSKLYRVLSNMGRVSIFALTAHGLNNGINNDKELAIYLAGCIVAAVGSHAAGVKASGLEHKIQQLKQNQR